MGITETVTDLLDPVVATLDVELVDVEWNGNTLRVVVDGLADRGVTTEQLTKVNRLASPILDQHDPIPGRYTLEVTSPGVERQLTKPDHYVRAVDEDVVVKLVPGVEPRRIKGRLVESDAEHVLIDAVEIDGVDLQEIQNHRISLSDIATARTVYEWGPGPKPGKKKQKIKQPPSKQQQKSRQQQASKKQAAKQPQPNSQSKQKREKS